MPGSDPGRFVILAARTVRRALGIAQARPGSNYSPPNQRHALLTLDSVNQTRDLV